MIQHGEKCERAEIIAAIDKLLILAINQGILDASYLVKPYRAGLCSCAERIITSIQEIIEK